MKQLFRLRQLKKILFILLEPVQSCDSKVSGIVLRQAESGYARARQRSAGKEGHIVKQKPVRHLTRFTRFSPIYRKADTASSPAGSVTRQPCGLPCFSSGQNSGTSNSVNCRCGGLLLTNAPSQGRRQPLTRVRTTIRLEKVESSVHSKTPVLPHFTHPISRRHLCSID